VLQFYNGFGAIYGWRVFMGCCGLNYCFVTVCIGLNNRRPIFRKAPTVDVSHVMHYFSYYFLVVLHWVLFWEPILDQRR